MGVRQILPHHWDSASNLDIPVNRISGPEQFPDCHPGPSAHESA